MKKGGHLSSPVGNEISCVMHGVDSKVLNNFKEIKSALKNALKNEKFTIVDEVSHIFSPYGFSILFLLAESHASIHTYPEYNSMTFHIYSCRGPKDGKKTFEKLKEKLKPKKIDFHERKVVVKSD